VHPGRVQKRPAPGVSTPMLMQNMPQVRPLFKDQMG
jgi:hypothetical protein